MPLCTPDANNVGNNNDCNNHLPLEDPTGVLKSRESELAVCLGGLSEGGALWMQVNFFTLLVYMYMYMYIV